MSKKGKEKFTPKDFESTGQKNDTSANIYESMLRSPAFMGLSKNQRLLYVYLKAQYFGKRKPKNDFPEVENLQNDECFYFNWGLAKYYRLYKNGNQKSFYNDLKSLEKRGFIKTISNGRSNKQKSIYMFSSEWKKWSYKDNESENTG